MDDIEALSEKTNVLYHVFKSSEVKLKQWYLSFDQANGTSSCHQAWAGIRVYRYLDVQQ